MQPWEYPVPPVLYKYLPPERLHVLSDSRIRFSQRTAFQDDHELQPEYAIFGTESEIWRYAISIGFPLSREGVPADVIAKYLAEDPQKQKAALANLKENIPVFDQLGVFCLTEAADCDEMWMEYAKNGTGFVIGFATTHAGFEKLKTPGCLGKVSYSDEPFGSALAAILENDGAGAMFRKRMRYAFEREWRIVRMLYRLEPCVHDVFSSTFDPASVCEIILRPDCTVKEHIRRLPSKDTRYKNLEVNLQSKVG